MPELIASDSPFPPELASMLEGYDAPAILVSSDYEVMACNRLYEERYGNLKQQEKRHCFEISHNYDRPCDQSGEECPLAAATESKHKERVLHIHQTPRGKEHVDVEMLPILDDAGELLYFVELMRSVPTSRAEHSAKGMVGQSAPFNAMLKRISRVCKTDASVLLVGESGTGKELVASAVHQGSTRSNNALVTLECAGLTDTLFETEMFGHVKGAFTGANTNRTGLVELAHGGTLFLDEIGDVPLSMQIKLLRLIETGTYRPVGSSQVKHSDFRLICATHKNIADMVLKGEFRQDLFYRINVFPLRVPSLGDRKDDLPLLVKTLLLRLAPDKQFHLTDSALQTLKRHTFYGNIRELRNILNRAVILTDTNVIQADTIDESLSIDAFPRANEEPTAQQRLAHTSASKESQAGEKWVDLKTAEANYIQKLMLAYNNDKTTVAKIAGISVRSLYRKLEDIET